MLKRYLVDSKYLFILSIFVAFMLPNFAVPLSFLLIPLLVIMMTVSIQDLEFHVVEEAKRKYLFYLPLINYVVLGGLTIVLSYFFISNIVYRQALYLAAVVPPAIGIVSMTYLLKGDVKLSFLAETAGYLASLVVVPIGTFFIFGDAVSPSKIFSTLFYIIILPFFLSRGIHFLKRKNVFSFSKEATRIVINFVYAFIFYIAIGANRDVFFTDFDSLFSILLIIVLLRFGLGTAFYWWFRGKVRQNIRVLFMVFGTLKNYATAMAFALVLLGLEATFPFAIISLITPLYLLYMQWLVFRAQL